MNLAGKQAEPGPKFKAALLQQVQKQKRIIKQKYWEEEMIKNLGEGTRHIVEKLREGVSVDDYLLGDWGMKWANCAEAEGRGKLNLFLF
jgi:hypothetical protein